MPNSAEKATAPCAPQLDRSPHDRENTQNRSVTEPTPTRRRHAVFTALESIAREKEPLRDGNPGQGLQGKVGKEAGR
jgi:hypothetical protein